VDDYAAWLLASFPEVQEVIVFGSFEKRTFSPGSDVDVFIRLSHSSKPVWDRLSDLLPKSFPLGLDVFSYTDAEIAERADSPLLLDVARSRWRYRRA
jgi:predicted nucleotidyltransferase